MHSRRRRHENIVGGVWNNERNSKRKFKIFLLMWSCAKKNFVIKVEVLKEIRECDNAQCLFLYV